MKKLVSVLITAAITLSIALPSAVSLAPVYAVDSSSSSSSSNSSGNTNIPSDEFAPYEIEDPQVFLYSWETTSIEAGGISPLNMTVATRKNNAYDISMSLEGPEGYTDAFKFYSASGKSFFSETLYINNKTINPFITAASSVPNGSYKVKVIFDYSSASGDHYTSSGSVSVIVNRRSNSTVSLKNAVFAKDQIGSDNKSPLNVLVANNTASDISNVTISLNSVKSEGFSLYDSYDSTKVSSIKANSSAKAIFNIYVNSSVADGNYPISFDVTYTNSDGSLNYDSFTLPVEVKRSADATGKGNTPRIIVEKYTVDTDTIKAGQDFTLDFTLQNTSSSVTVQNIKVVVGSVTTSGTGTNASSSAVFFPAEGSNSFYIEKIAPKASVSEKIRLMARQDIEPGVYAVLLSLNYEDGNGAAVPASEEQISFSVTQEQRLEIQGMNIPTDITGGSLPISFQYINKGKATIYNLSVTVDGDFTMEGGSQYIGNLTAGYNDYFDNVATPNGEGNLKGAVVLKYEDSNGNEQEYRQEFACNVIAQNIEAMDPGMNGGMTINGMNPTGDMPKAGPNWLIISIIIVAVLAVGAAAAIIIIKKKKKAKKAMVDDEDD